MSRPIQRWSSCARASSCCWASSSSALSSPPRSAQPCQGFQGYGFRSFPGVAAPHALSAATAVPMCMAPREGFHEPHLLVDVLRCCLLHEGCRPSSHAAGCHLLRLCHLHLAVRSSATCMRALLLPSSCAWQCAENEDLHEAHLKSSLPAAVLPAAQGCRRMPWVQARRDIHVTACRQLLGSKY